MKMGSVDTPKAVNMTIGEMEQSLLIFKVQQL